ncbi:MAG: 7,8-didemethyl-8-hydroxy-5-deazariboflavin synthase subunit CofG [Oscillatoriales cyanobacterium]|nr:MAG: 7,8-didemethyl-8-hydroxy-5-deazariboflavin synthase subunit CofG [Oscillatoriales cyanobacterium]
MKSTQPASDQRPQALAGPAIVTYSPAYTVVPTYECFNRCTYCNFRRDPGADRWLGLDSAATLLRSLTPDVTDVYDSTVYDSMGLAEGEIAPPRLSPSNGGSRLIQIPIEVLILSGEVHPRSPRRSAWFHRIESLCQLALLAGFLPHTNAGPLDRAEMAQLGRLNVSMGLMLEQLSPGLQQTVHRHAPSKDPEQRLAQLRQAGELRIPFTTGLLIGIGETAADRLETLRAIAQIQRRYGHIQEVIIQPHSPGSQQAWVGEPCTIDTLIDVVAIARELLPESVVIQVPPNLLNQAETIQQAIVLGASDLGGICPIDHVNPDYGHPNLAQLADWVAAAGGCLQARLPIYPAFDDWLVEPVRSLVQRWRDYLQQPDHCPPPTAQP